MRSVWERWTKIVPVFYIPSCKAGAPLFLSACVVCLIKKLASLEPVRFGSRFFCLCGHAKKIVAIQIALFSACVDTRKNSRDSNRAFLVCGNAPNNTFFVYFIEHFKDVHFPVRFTNKSLPAFSIIYSCHLALTIYKYQEHTEKANNLYLAVFVICRLLRPRPFTQSFPFFSLIHCWSYKRLWEIWYSPLSVIRIQDFSTETSKLERVLSKTEGFILDNSTAVLLCHWTFNVGEYCDIQILMHAQLSWSISCKG